MEKIGFIGLGAMGAAMAHNIARAGYQLGVYNRSTVRSQVFQDQGFPVYTSPAETAQACEAVVIMVRDPAALSEILHSDNGLLQGLRDNAPGNKLIINMSTVSPAATLSTAAAVRDAGARFIDAPVSGTVKPAEDGNLLILAAGENGDIDSAEPLLKTMGKSVLRCGAVGQATRLKLVLNLILAGMMQSLAEGLQLANSQDIAGSTVLQALQGGPLGAGLYSMKGPMMIEGNFKKQFPVDLMFKDLNLVLETAGEARQPLPMTASIRETFSSARNLGYGDEDVAALIKVLQRGSGAQN